MLQNNLIVCLKHASQLDKLNVYEHFAALNIPSKKKSGYDLWHHIIVHFLRLLDLFNNLLSLLFMIVLVFQLLAFLESLFLFLKLIKMKFRALRLALQVVCYDFTIKSIEPPTCFI